MIKASFQMGSEICPKSMKSVSKIGAIGVRRIPKGRQGAKMKKRGSKFKLVSPLGSDFKGKWDPKWISKCMRIILKMCIKSIGKSINIQISFLIFIDLTMIFRRPEHSKSNRIGAIAKSIKV